MGSVFMSYYSLQKMRVNNKCNHDKYDLVYVPSHYLTGTKTYGISAIIDTKDLYDPNRHDYDIFYYHTEKRSCYRTNFTMMVGQDNWEGLIFNHFEDYHDRNGRFTTNNNFTNIGTLDYKKDLDFYMQVALRHYH